MRVMGSSPSSLLTIDVGNSSTSFGYFSLTGHPKNPRPKKNWTMPTEDLRHPQRGLRALRKALRKYQIKRTGTDVMVSSVVPSVDSLLRAGIKTLLANPPVHFVTAQTKSKIKNLYRKPTEVGADRLVNARGAISLKKGPLIIVDFGTATTFDCVTKRAEYLGGVIAPGPVISAEALYQKTAKLPRVVLVKPAKVLGQNTLESIQSGLYHGYRGLVREILVQLKKKMGPQTNVIGTGGQSIWILKGMPGITSVPHLTHLGLYWYWRDVRGAYRRKDN